MLDASTGEEQNIFFESVFVLSEVGNVVVSRLRDGEQHSSLYSYVAVCVRIPTSYYPSVGYRVVYLSQGHTTTSYLIDDS